MIEIKMIGIKMIVTTITIMITIIMMITTIAIMTIQAERVAL